jgi:hypothetical protein
MREKEKIRNNHEKEYCDINRNMQSFYYTKRRHFHQPGITKIKQLFTHIR